MIFTPILTFPMIEKTGTHMIHSPLELLIINPTINHGLFQKTMYLMVFDFQGI